MTTPPNSTVTLESTATPEWLTPEALARLKELEYDFHVRAFGEEMARVNFLPLEERKRYVHDMIDKARSKGVSFEKPCTGVTR